jgi:thiosulfate dehydrogenase
VSCHLDEGRRAQGTWVGVYGRYPQYRSRSGTVELIEDRVNDCFRRSLNGRALDPTGRDMRDIVAYLAFLSRGVSAGAPAPAARSPFDTLIPDTAAGGRVFASTCAVCHGANGEGTTVAPAAWGSRSFNIGAGMARRLTAAAFIRVNMPFTAPGTLTDQQALDVAAYITSRARPDFPDKQYDWPNGGAPPDVAYQVVGRPKPPERR